MFTAYSYVRKSIDQGRLKTIEPYKSSHVRTSYIKMESHLKRIVAAKRYKCIVENINNSFYACFMTLYKLDLVLHTF